MLDIKSVSDNVATILRVLTPKLTIAFAIAAWLLLLISARGWMPLPQGIVVSALVVGIFSTCLVFTSLIAWLWKAVRPVREAIVRAAYVRSDKIRVEGEIGFLTADERHIIAY